LIVDPKYNAILRFLPDYFFFFTTPRKKMMMLLTITPAQVTRILWAD